MGLTYPKHVVLILVFATLWMPLNRSMKKVHNQIVKP